MTDLLTVLPRLSTAPFSNVLPSLERNKITVADLLTLDAASIAKAAQIPVREVRRLTEAVLEALSSQLRNPFRDHDPSKQDVASGINDVDAKRFSDDISAPSLICNGVELSQRWHTISCLDDELDSALGGGFPTGYLSEVTGESGVGKTHLLLSLLLAVQLPPPRGLSRNAVYISTEASISTTRLQQILSAHPYFAEQAPQSVPMTSLSRILTLQTADLESQDHVLRYQLPIALRRHNVGLVVIDSITANYRAEFERSAASQSDSGLGKRTTLNGPAAMARRSASLIETAAMLRGYARDYNVAIIVANQVADRFSTPVLRYGSEAMSTGAQVPPGSLPSATPIEGPASSPMATQYPDDLDMLEDDALTLDHQQRWFTGWGDEVPHRTSVIGMKTPSLGMVWTNQLACRIALTRRLVRSADGGGMRWQRHFKVVFAPWCQDHTGHRGIEFNVEAQGLVSVGSRKEQSA